MGKTAEQIVFLGFVIIINAVGTTGELSIVAPYPMNIYSIENTNAEVTCVAFDDKDESVRPRIVFMLRDAFGVTTEIPDEGPKGHTYYTNRTEDNGRKLFTTLHIKNVTAIDDSLIAGRYDCQGEGAHKTARYGFGFTVISRSTLPIIKVSDDVITEFGDQITLTCNVTNIEVVQLWTRLVKLTWMKDGVVLEAHSFPVTNQDEKSLKITLTKSKDGGVYTCIIATLLRRAKPYNVSGDIVVKVNVKFFEAPSKVVGNITESIALECPAEGYPLNIRWSKLTNDGREISSQDAQDISNNTSRFIASRPCPYCRYTLTIKDLKSYDEGVYICKETRGTGKHEFELSIPVSNSTGSTEGSTGVSNSTGSTEGSTGVSSATKATLQTILNVVGFLWMFLKMN